MRLLCFLISMHVVLCRLLAKDILDCSIVHFEARLISTDYIWKVRQMCISWCCAKFFKIPKALFDTFRSLGAESSRIKIFKLEKFYRYV